MSDVTVRWPTAPNGPVREETFENVRIEVLLAGQVFLGYILKGNGFQVTLPFVRIEMVTERFERDPRDDDKPDTSPSRLTVVPR
jgi:hypothetical protein